MNESELLAQIRLALGRDERVVLWRNNTGMTRESDTGRPVRYGLCVGSSDLVGIVTMGNGCGRFVALEVKTERGRVSAEQAMFLALVNRRGGYGVVVRSIEDAQRAVDAACAGVTVHEPTDPTNA